MPYPATPRPGSAAIIAPLTDTNPETGERLDYRKFSESVEKLVRDKYQTDTINIRITGFAKLVGDLIDGATQVALFFAVAFFITLVLLALYSRCYYATLIPLICSTIAVVWQLGLLHTLGFGLDPYSMLVPFLIFAIGISHGVQIINNTEWPVVTTRKLEAGIAVRSGETIVLGGLVMNSTRRIALLLLVLGIVLSAAAPAGAVMTTPSAVASTSSSVDVGRFLPTKSGRIGSSR